MENIIYQTFSSRRNTGFPAQGSFFNPQITKGSYLVPFDFSVAVTPNDSDDTIRAAVLTALLAALKNDNALSRAYYIGDYINFEDKSDKQAMQKYNYGTEVESNRGKYKLEFQFENAGFGFFQSVKGFHNLQDMFKVIHVDTNRLYGTNKLDATGTLVGFQGYTLDFLNVPDWMWTSYDKRAQYAIGYHHANPKEMNEELFVVDMKQNMLKYGRTNGVIDVVITGSMTGTRIATISLKTRVGNVNLGDLHAAALDLANNLSIKNKNTGVDITISSVGTYNAATGTYAVTMASTGGYSASNPCVIKLKSVSTLIAVPLPAYESNTLELTMN
ncbi:hypothetical protein UFOVP74_41 [uncultured Caudovirales phage]|uniref:Uncharacterized protein n=1 Tax=uncultured Caudovirales phage TaxID=2100421 RepID=A0A6J5KZK6_9CAUD|nr:hypothetical protein UFOVP74_41 [uncultured Caudovirales phage]